MEVHIEGVHVHISQHLENYVNTKLKKLERHFHQITTVSVSLTSHETSSYRAEATIHLSGGEIFADASASELYAAVDLLADKLDRQVIRRKEKLQDHRGHRRSHAQS